MQWYNIENCSECCNRYRFRCPRETSQDFCFEFFQCCPGDGKKVNNRLNKISRYAFQYSKNEIFPHIRGTLTLILRFQYQLKYFKPHKFNFRERNTLQAQETCFTLRVFISCISLGESSSGISTTEYEMEKFRKRSFLRSSHESITCLCLALRGKCFKNTG